MEVLDHVDVDRMRALKERGEFFWLDLLRPSEPELDTLGAVLDLPPLALEDAKEFRQRPKLDDYGGPGQLASTPAAGSSSSSAARPAPTSPSRSICTSAATTSSRSAAPPAGSWTAR